MTLDLPPGDEFGELGTFFNAVSAQLSADRSQMAGQVANLESAVELLEDAVVILRRTLSANHPLVVSTTSDLERARQIR